MKVVFLDIDGVVATNRSLYKELSNYFGIPVKELNMLGPTEMCERTGLKYPRVSMYQWPFDSIAIDNIYRLHQITKCQFVLSSSWRVGRTVKEAHDILSMKGLKVPILSKTQYLDTRGQEIKDWIENIFPKQFPDEEIESYAIIDDECYYDIIQLHPDNCVQTTQHSGFSARHLKETIKILLNL